jgi:PAS domain-containing protein
LKTARDLYSDLFHLASAGYCTLSRKDTILEAYQILAVLLGIKREELIRQPLSHFVDFEDQNEYYLHRQRAFEDRQRHNSINRMVKGSAEINRYPPGEPDRPPR